MKKLLHTTFSSLKVRNYRLYFFAQSISVPGTFLQMFAQDWLVLQLTNSGTILGIVTALQFLPMLLFTPWGGAIADAFSKKKVLYATQVVFATLALVLGVLVLTHTIQIWMLFIFALVTGINNCVDDPTRKAFMYELLGKSDVKNGLSLWTMLIGASRVVGPALAGILIVWVGIGFCFVINALSYIIVLWAVYTIRHEDTSSAQPSERGTGTVLEALKYVWSHSLVFNILFQFALVGIFTMEWQVSIPLFAKFALHGNAGTYSLMAMSEGVGMFMGGLASAHRKDDSELMTTYLLLLLGISVLFASLTSSIVVAMGAFFCIGFLLICYMTLVALKLRSYVDPRMNGRIMAFWTVAFQGSTTLGGPFVGWIGEVFGARIPLVVAGVAAIVAAGYGFVAMRRNAETMQPAAV
jgi:MFS family permease